MTKNEVAIGVYHFKSDDKEKHFRTDKNESGNIEVICGKHKSVYLDHKTGKYKPTPEEQINYAESDRYTYIEKFVTCPRCIKILKK